jgi:predicted dinucleotide-binding enzyme
VFAVWFDALKQVITEYADLLDGKVAVDPSNPIGVTADGTFFRKASPRAHWWRQCCRPAPTT